MIYFTSDWHLGENRLGNEKPNVFFRPFKNTEENDLVILNNFRSVFKDGDILYHLGDVTINETSYYHLRQLKEDYPNSQFILVIGNYDENKLNGLKILFDEIVPSTTLTINSNTYVLNHYPTKLKSNIAPDIMGITGHIHGLWKVQENMINVGVDAWHFKPVSIDEIEFISNAMRNYYDDNVFVNRSL